MKHKVSRIRKILSGMALIGIAVLFPFYAKADDNLIESAKNGVVEIHAGLRDEKDNFHIIKSTSGCLVSNLDNGVYVVTTYHSIDITDKEREKFCKDQELNAESANLSECIEIVVKGDISVEASVAAGSEAQDFCVLSAESVLNEKSPLSLGNNEKIMIGDPVYILGFENNESNGAFAQYDASEVKIHGGMIQDTSARISRISYLQHSGVITEENSGGPVLDADGYMIGMNNNALSDSDASEYFALPVGTIRDVLDNYGILYNSREREEAYAVLMQTTEECTKILSSKKYRKQSLENLSSVLQSVSAAVQNKTCSLEQIQEAQDILNQAIMQVEEKMPFSRKAVYALAVILTILAVYAVYLFVWFHRQKHAITPERKAGQGKKKETDMGAADVQSAGVCTSTGDKNQIFNGKTEGAGKNADRERNSHTTRENEQSAYDETVLLSQYKKKTDMPEPSRTLEEKFSQQAPEACLIRKSSGLTIPITKPFYSLGKKNSVVDFAILNNPAVSRVHAVIRWSDRGYMICDLESVNGTFVNNRKVAGNGQLLSDGDEVKLADEKFIFKIKNTCE